MNSRCSLWLALVALIISCASIRADAKPEPAAKGSPALPKLGEIKTLSVHPAKVSLKGGDDAQQLILTATLTDGRVQDLSSDCKYEPADAKIAKVTALGQVMPLANGSTEITVSFADQSVKVPVTAEAVDENLPINFANQVVPIFTKVGCNAGGCHGKASGQNGFRLSLLGFEPEVDYNSLVKEARGRRLFPASPENSLLLLKATGAVAHGGGKRIEPDSDEYKLIRRWITAGMPVGKSTDPTVTKISMFPEQRVLTRKNKQQFAVYAHYSDGRVEDITRRAQYESNDSEIAVVDMHGVVSTLKRSGEAAIMARYQGHVATFRATVPVGEKMVDYKFEPKTVVDRHTQKKWKELGLVPSEACTDEEFIRRASLDIAGTMPTPEQVKAFTADTAADKRDKLVDKLLDSPEYSYFFASKWADILRVKRRGQQERAQGTFAFHDWIREAVAADKPYDEFARELLTATGEEMKSPATVWYKELQQPEQFVDDVSQVFLGLRLACAQCHHHPYEKWSQDDYWGMAAFFGRVGRKNVPMPGMSSQGQVRQQQYVFAKTNGNVNNKRTGQVAVMKALDAEAIKPGPDDDPRQKLAEWMTDTKNPFFAKAVANRYWAHFLGRGIVDPPDDMRITNPPSNPELLDALAKDLVDNKFSLKGLIRTICKSRTYQLSSLPNDHNKNDRQAYARYYPKRLSAEVLFDGVCAVTKTPPNFNGLPKDKHAPNRAIMLPDESFPSYFLDVFGRPQRLSACECERGTEANLAQRLHLLNSDEMQNRLAAGGGRADLLVKDARPDEEKVEELFLLAFARKPTGADLENAMAHIQKHKESKKTAYENLIWALVNSKEFSFNK